jgi:geranyl diphosphate synthase
MAYIYYIMVFTMQGVITAPMLYAMEEFPQLQEVVDRGFDNPANIEIVSSYFRL